MFPWLLSHLPPDRGQHYHRTLSVITTSGAHWKWSLSSGAQKEHTLQSQPRCLKGGHADLFQHKLRFEGFFFFFFFTLSKEQTKENILFSRFGLLPLIYFPLLWKNLFFQILLQLRPLPGQLSTYPGKQLQHFLQVTRSGEAVIELVVVVAAAVAIIATTTVIYWGLCARPYAKLFVWA